MILRVFVSDLIVKRAKYGRVSYWVFGTLQSGLRVVISDYYHDLKEHIGCHIDVLLSFMRSPYYEQKIGIHNLIFSPEKYYSVELIDELLSKEEVVSARNEGVVVLTGEYIDSYTIPERWSPLPQRGSFQALFKEPSALKTEDGMFLLSPFHSRKAVSIDQIPSEVTMAGGLNLEAWRPSK